MTVSHRWDAGVEPAARGHAPRTARGELRRGIAAAAVRSSFVVVLPPFSITLRMWFHWQNQCCDRHSSRKRPLKLSMHAFWFAG